MSQGIAANNNFELNGVNQTNSPGLGQWGLTNTTLIARYWPFVDEQRQAFADIGAFLTPPTGTNVVSRTLNVAANAWQGDIQIGGHKGFGPNFSVDAAADAVFIGDRARPAGAVATDPAYSIQLWANWDWSSQFRTSAGYAGTWGGQWYSIVPSPAGALTYNGYRSAEAQKIRAQAAYWWTPRIRMALELTHGLATPGGYQLNLGVNAQLKVLF